MIVSHTKSTLSAHERILTTAHDLFYRDGIRATGIDRVIAEAGVTKVTFYRHFPSKADLILAYLEHRHRLWMGWLSKAIKRHRKRGRSLNALFVAVFREWFESRDYRGCAFINAVVELQSSLPEVADIARRHKDEVVEMIVGLLPETKDRQAVAQAVAAALDGAIVRAQMEKTSGFALAALETILRALLEAY